MVSYCDDSSCYTATNDDAWYTWNSTACDVTGATTSATSTATWRIWVTSNATTTTATSNVVTTGAGVWKSWIAVDDGTYLRIRAPQPKDAVRLSEEEQAEQAARFLQQAAELWFKVEMDSLAARLAHRRAEELLLANLNAQQQAQYAKEKKFKVIGGDGASFELGSAWSGNVREFAKDGKPLARFCIHPREHVPLPDLLLMQKLMLETDPDTFRKTANRTELAHR